VDVDRLFRERGRGGCRFDKGHVGGSARRVAGADGGEHLVDGFGEASVGTEVDGQLHRQAWDAAEPAFADLREKLDLGLAKHIDGLHGIADQEDGAIFIGVGGVAPCREKLGDELVLAARGVLKFVDEEMTDVAGDVEDAFRVLFENGEGGDRELDEIDFIVFGEDDFELDDGLAQDGEDLAQRPPLAVAVGVGWEVADRAKAGEESRRLLQTLEAVLHFALALFLFPCAGGEALTFVDVPSPIAVFGQKQGANAAPVIQRHRGRQRRHSGEESDVLEALIGGIVGQIKKLMLESRFGGEQAVGFREDSMILATERRFEVRADRLPVILGHRGGDGEGVLPVVADLQHVGDERFALREAIVAEVEEMVEGLVEDEIGATELLDGAACSGGVERFCLLGGMEMAAEPRQQRTIVRDAQAKRVDGLDDEAVGMVEDIPAAALGVSERFAGQHNAVLFFGVGIAATGRGFEVGENARAHLRCGRECEGDGKNFFGLVDDGQQAEIAAGEEVGFSGAGGSLHDDGAANVERGFARARIGGSFDEQVSHQLPSRLRRRSQQRS
jgi:hypothetical protein